MPRTQLNAAKLSTLASTAAFIVSARQSRLPDARIAHEMLREGLRKLHDHARSFRGAGKFLGHVHWSRQALRIVRREGGLTRTAQLQLRHEHVVPAGQVVRLLFSLGPRATTEAAAKYINKYSLVAIITREQDKLFGQHGLRDRMPEGWNGRDVWARYKAVGLYEHITDA